jgi:ATP synthase in type III secretion protein N
VSGLARLRRALSVELLPVRGRVTRVAGLAVEATAIGARLGDRVEILSAGRAALPAEVVGMREGRLVLLPLGMLDGLGPDSEVLPAGSPLAIRAGEGLVGRVLDGLGRPADGRPLPPGLEEWPVDREAPAPLSRPLVHCPLPLGVRALDALATVGEGQRLGLFAGSGVGKSTLLAQIARATEAERIVVALVGERGREVREFVEGALGPSGLARAVLVVATSDAPALVRFRAAHVATALAEWFAEQGRRVLLLLDSITRYARALREVGLAAGEPPVRQGYPPSVFSALPRLLERAGCRARGSITAVYTVLVAGDDLEEPVADEVRGTLDGHVVLDRRIGAAGRYPAVDVLRSLSRTMPAVVSPAHALAAERVRALLAAHERVRDLVALGAYRPGADPLADRARERLPALEDFLRQGVAEVAPFEETVARLEELAR